MAALSKWDPIIGTVSIEQLIYQKLKPTAIDKVGGIYCHLCHLKFGNKKEFDSHYIHHGTGSADIIYTCVICHKEIVGYPSFRGHCYLAHVTKDKFKCGQCDRMFSKQCILDTHIKAVHEAVHTCLICQKQFQCRKQLLIHKMVHKNADSGPPYECQTCGEHIETSNDCEIHVEDHCSMFYTCPICNEDITNLQFAASHLTKHFGNVLKKKTNEESKIIEIPNDSWINLVGGILCCYCNNIYDARKDFDSHILLDHPNEQIIYACNICGKEFEKYLSLAQHGYDHTAKDRFECEDCFRTFPRLSLLVIHMEAYHSKNSLQFTCLQCSHSFETYRRLKDHYRVTHNIYYSQCPEQGCGKIFSAPKDLIFHLKQHSDHNWCKKCGLRFSSLQACEKHLQYHKKKLYSCPICSKNYKEKYLTLKHLTQHFSAVLHVCKICGKVYNSRSRLVQHAKVHSEVKPHICPYCNKGFTKMYLLQQHVNVHTGLKPYKCTNCPKTFASYPNWRKHLLKIHNTTAPFSQMMENENSVENHLDKGVDSNETLMNENEVSDEISHDNDNVQENAKVESKFENVCMELSNSFEESNESVDQSVLDSIDPIALELLEEHLMNSQEMVVDGVVNTNDLHKDLSSSSIVQLDSCSAVVPCEYGPEFVCGAEAGAAGAGVIPLGDPPLPHIDPRLTILHPPQPPQSPQPPQPPESPQSPEVGFDAPQTYPKWEPPILTKLDYSDFDATIWDQIII